MKPFSNSEHLYNRVKELINEQDIDTAIETGTYKGATTLALSEMVDKVITIEKNVDQAKETINDRLVGTDNITVLIGDSRDMLSEVIEEAGGNLFFYLDAHSWQNDDNPIRKELITIYEHKIKPTIVIHDFKVPGRYDLGYNSYRTGTQLDWRHINRLVKDIYSESFNREYNDDAPKGERGVIFLTPC